VHKPFYASGFLYHLGTAQILLHQPTDTIVASSWHLLGGKGTKGEDTKAAFKRIAHELVKIKLDLKNIIPVYDYFDTHHNLLHYVFYAEVTEQKTSAKQKNIAWFTFKQATKLPFTHQTKQNIIVAERVIKARVRDEEAKNAPPIDPNLKKS